jgi:ketosteroid isomerase-like protein
MTLAWLNDLELLRRLPQRYARAVDARDHDALARLFFADGVMVGARGEQVAADYVAASRAATPAYATSMHVLGVPLIELEPGAQTARSDTYAVVYQLGAVNGGGDLTLGLRYLDELERDGDAWRIRRRTAQILWTKPT